MIQVVDFNEIEKHLKHKDDTICSKCFNILKQEEE